MSVDLEDLTGLATGFGLLDAADGEAGRAAGLIKHLSKSQVSNMARALDEHFESFRTRPLCGPYTIVAADALTMKVREAGRVVNVPP